MKPWSCHSPSMAVTYIWVARSRSARRVALLTSSGLRLSWAGSIGEGFRGRGHSSVVATTLHVASSGAGKYEAIRLSSSGWCFSARSQWVVASLPQ
jgi:hypothetical protein